MSYKYLFIDDFWIDHTYSLHRVLGKIKKDPKNPIIKADQPWEKGVKLYGTVLKLNGSYHMWYQMLNLREKNLSWATGVGYAQSKDGRVWNKPRIGIIHPDFGVTNVVQQSSGRSHLCSPSVILSNGLYHMMFYDAMYQDDIDKFGSPYDLDPEVPGWTPVIGEGVFMSSSPDGIHWTRDKFPIFSGPNDVVSCANLTSKSNWLATFKTSFRKDRHHRVIASASSNNLIDWIQNGVVLEPDHNDPFGTEFYGMTCYDYFGTLIGLLSVYHNSPDDKSMDIQLAISHDGIKWSRFASRDPFIELGPSGMWDAGGIFVSSELMLDDTDEASEINLYYSAINTKHDDFRYKEWSIGRLSFRMDGFAALESRFFPGLLVTKPIKVRGNCLNINADLSAGEIQVEIYDSKTRTLVERLRRKKYSSRTIHKFKLNNKYENLESYLEIKLTNSKIYSFYFNHI
jgi:hypothetical protein